MFLRVTPDLLNKENEWRIDSECVYFSLYPPYWNRMELLENQVVRKFASCLLVFSRLKGINFHLNSFSFPYSNGTLDINGILSIVKNGKFVNWKYFPRRLLFLKIYSSTLCGATQITTSNSMTFRHRCDVFTSLLPNIMTFEHNNHIFTPCLFESVIQVDILFSVSSPNISHFYAQRFDSSWILLLYV